MELDADVESLETSTPWAAVAFGNKHKMVTSYLVLCPFVIVSYIAVSFGIRDRDVSKRYSL
jgi:hypothetical protein